MGWNILVRDSLQDSGQSPSPGYPYTSPDIICNQNQLVADPTSTYTANYSSDPNKALIVNQSNYIYVRGKNLGSTASGGTVYLYWCPSSLLMTPDQWTPNALLANVNNQWQPFDTLPSVNANAVTVTQAPFTWTPAALPSGQHYCMVGAVSTLANPWTAADIPPFPTWDSFVMWVRTNQNICWRNMTLVTNPNEPEWDQLNLISNRFNSQILMAVSAQCSGVPIGTTVQLLNTALGINQTTTVTSPDQAIPGPSAFLPPQYSGYMETIAQAPSGTSWPSGASIQTTLYFGSDSQEEIAMFAEDFGPLERDENIIRAKALAAGRSNVGVLIKVGNCSIGYQPSS
ncbi:hypothetical protein [Pseudolabrys sp. FHR47]|uniref:hypothetical protein n=1 Tax=Pseudolabrys sp. FHR47 TaxID=2562284 RepID=UPI0010BE466D|nr:hypothetical protein [Pseudolabrys sp. FHR47]